MNQKAFRKEQNKKKRSQELQSLRERLQQISEVDKAFIAGLIEGEGWLGLHWNKIAKGHYKYPVPQFGLTNTEASMIKYLSDTLKIGTITWQPHGDWKPQIKFSVTRTIELIALLEIVLPYLKWKKDEAEILLNWLLVRWEKYKQQRGYSSEELIAVKQIQKIREGREGRSIELLNLITSKKRGKK